MPARAVLMYQKKLYLMSVYKYGNVLPVREDMVGELLHPLHLGNISEWFGWKLILYQ